MGPSIVRWGYLTLALVSCASTTATSSGGSPGGPTGGGSFERPGGAQTLRKGERHQVEIDAGQTHEWGIQLGAGEAVTLSMQAASTGPTMCQSWSWGFYNPRGDVLREQPAQPDESGRWSMELQQTAEASIAEGPTAGRYTVRVSAGSDCPQLHYTLGAR